MKVIKGEKGKLLYGTYDKKENRNILIDDIKRVYYERDYNNNAISPQK